MFRPAHMIDAKAWVDIHSAGWVSGVEAVVTPACGWGWDADISQCEPGCGGEGEASVSEGSANSNGGCKERGLGRGGTCEAVLAVAACIILSTFVVAPGDVSVFYSSSIYLSFLTSSCLFSRRYDTQPYHSTPSPYLSFHQRTSRCLTTLNLAHLTARKGSGTTSPCHLQASSLSDNLVPVPPFVVSFIISGYAFILSLSSPFSPGPPPFCLFTCFDVLDV
ncbi:hypothetical protein FA13DRAFT_59786 [Coprinellus micaceus]|uniref:Uncharacterized protein n=1 Tax=Coprinellus micaceus TaxID=71717 RepID=A0A4Y7U2Z8_COPMI|nr:hypothetical protein FA13DRAFT_59786 [Coprinellus micaceus]